MRAGMSLGVPHGIRRQRTTRPVEDWCSCWLLLPMVPRTCSELERRRREWPIFQCIWGLDGAAVVVVAVISDDDDGVLVLVRRTVVVSPFLPRKNSMKYFYILLSHRVAPPHSSRTLYSALSSHSSSSRSFDGVGCGRAVLLCVMGTITRGYTQRKKRVFYELWQIVVGLGLMFF